MNTTNNIRYIDFILPTAPPAPPAPQFSREEQLHTLWKQGVLSQDFLLMDSSRNDLAALSGAIAKERGLDFSAAMNVALYEIPPLDFVHDFTESDFDLNTQQGRDNLAKAANRLARTEKIDFVTAVNRIVRSLDNE